MIMCSGLLMVHGTRLGTTGLEEMTQLCGRSTRNGVRHARGSRSERKGGACVCVNVYV